VVADSYLYRSRGNNRYTPGTTTPARGTYASTQEASSDSSIRYYKVRQGDTLSRIAKKTGTTVAQLCKLNKISTTTTLRLGRVLRCS
jgi:LysM repeat protein